MERSRSKRNYYYEPQDYDSDTVPRTRARYNNTHYPPSNHRHRGNSARPSKPPQDQSPVLTTTYRILCHDMKVGGVIGKSGSIIKSIRQHTGAWINVHELVPGDDERIIEITDTRRRDPDGRLPSFSPAQEALIMIHERTLESDVGAGFSGTKYDTGDEEDEYGAVRGGGGNRVATRLVVSRMHVGCLLGKGGKIIEQMRNETKTQIRVLPRDHNIPRCVSMSEEIVQVVGDPNAVKNAVSIIASRLRESQHRDRSHFHGRIQSPERFYSPEDDYMPPATNVARRSSMDGASVRSRLSTNNSRGSNYTARSFTSDTGASPMVDNMQPFYSDELMVFRMLCPTDRVESIVGESDGFVELLQNEVGVDVKVSDAIAGSEEQIIVISSEEGPDDDLFPAQEALLHIQTRIVDIVPDKENIVTTRLVVSSSDIVCLEGRSGSLLEMKKMTGADIQILPREELPACVASTDELVQIIGEIKAARDALVEVTSRLRSYIYRELFQKDVNPSPSSVVGKETLSPNNNAGTRQVHSGNDSQNAPHLNVQPLPSTQPIKAIGYSASELTKQSESDHTQDVPSSLNRIPVPLVTRSTIEVVIPEHAFPKLLSKSKSKLSQISELSGANVKLIEDQPEMTQKIIQISGAPEQVERAQSLLQGFILSTQEDDP